MTIGERIEQRRIALKIRSQSALARRADIPQTTLNGIINNPYRWSPHLARIAQALQTTVEYLSGLTDDPDGLPPPALSEPPIQFVTLQVALPNQRALARMFEGLLRAMPPGAGLDEQAELLAQRLPIGLAQLRDLLPALPPPTPTLDEERASAIPEPVRQ